MTNELRERLHHLADAAADGIELTRPERTGRTRLRRWAVPTFAGAAAAALVAIVAGTAIVTNGDRGDDSEVFAGPRADFTPAAVVAVTYGFGGEVTTAPDDLDLRFLDADGQVFAERSWDEVLERPPGASPDELTALGGLLQEVPIGDLRLEVTLRTDGASASCTQPFTAARGDRLILRLQLATATPRGADPVCAPIESVDEWVQGRTSGPTGESYVGLTTTEAEARAETDGLTTRLVANNGMDLATTRDLQCDRLDLTVFDGVVVAADLPQESTPDQCNGVAIPR